MQTTGRGSGRLGRRSALTLLPAFLLGCAHGPTPIEYPKIRVDTASFELNIQDRRKSLYTTVNEQSEAYEAGSETFPQKLPEAFEAAGVQRLSRLTSESGLPLKVELNVKRADVTFFNEPRGKFARYDVNLGIRITTDNGTLLESGNGSSWQEVPEREFSKARLKEVFEATALEAFDRYFASEATLNKLNRQIAAYNKSYPGR